MPVRVVEFHHQAEREIHSAERWYRRRSPSSAQRFLQAVDETVQRIATAAELGSPYQQQTRWMRVKRFPYVIHYEIRDPHPIYIYAATHTSRRPSYWRRRRPP
jgi:plasmid stabilization system protein ParE